MSWTAFESSAAENELSLPTEPPIISKDDFADEDLNPFATQYVKNGYSSIELLTNTTLKVSGNTSAYTSVDTIRVTLYLQQWNPSKKQWVDVLTVGPATNYRSNSISYSKQVNVISGYSYRIRAHHDIIHNGITERLTSVSNQISAD
ncbi:DUF6147 family protein [Sporosarcina sp. NPDC096371]|uniref:DUF6147 family protein n=1 Tax=Sporosarcina sp. NPDC096371 TaxID=3364530 RepID=UPI00381AF140